MNFVRRYRSNKQAIIKAKHTMLLLQVTKTKKWKEICGVISIGSSASAAFTLKKNYIKYLFAYECQFDRGGMDPQPVLAQIEAQLQQKREQKNRGRAPSPGKNYS